MPIPLADGRRRPPWTVLRRWFLSQVVVPPALDVKHQTQLKAAVRELPVQTGIDLFNWNWKAMHRRVTPRAVSPSPNTIPDDDGSAHLAAAAVAELGPPDGDSVDAAVPSAFALFPRTCLTTGPRLRLLVIVGHNFRHKQFQRAHGLLMGQVAPLKGR